ncbi:MAG: regulatory protein RecX [Desulfuromonadales bacterium]|nr:regulatory protein RecX [Desulfuromonadales bacterium]
MELKTKSSSAAAAYAAALRLLTRRGYAEAELHGRLLDKGYDAADVDATLTRCRALGYLDDAHFAQQRALALLRNGRAVGRRACLDLRHRGITAELAATAVAAAESEHPPQELLRAQLARRYPHFDYATADAASRRRIINFFLRRGFELSLVLTTLQTEKDNRS